MDGFFGNQSSCEQEGLFLERIPQGRKRTTFSMGCNIPCDHAPTYTEGFFHWNGLREVDQPRSAEESSITIFMTPMIEQAVSSGISCDKISVMDKDDPIAISHIF